MSLARRIRVWAGGVGLWRKMAIALAVAALGSGIATYLALTGAPPFGPGPQRRPDPASISIWCCCSRLARWSPSGLLRSGLERRRGLAGSRLQVRLVGLFSLIAVMPTIIVAVFSYLFFSFGVESWFSDKVRTAISESVAVADAYVKEHQQAIRADALAMAAGLDRYAASLQLNPQYLAPVLTAQAAMRGLTEAAILDRARARCWRAPVSSSASASRMSAGMRLRRAQQGEVVIMTDDREERVRALVRLNEFSDLYLYVGRFIEPRVLAHRENTHLAAAQYERLEGQRSGFQITFAVIYILVAMLFLAAAILIGIHFAAQIAGPISGLVAAAERIRAGDLSARVPEGERGRRTRSLSRAFNRMTYQIQSQQRELIEANRAARRAAAVHRDGVDRRFGGRHRARPRRPHLSAEPLGLGSARRRSRPVDRRGSRRSRAGDGRTARARRRAARTGWRKARCRSPDRTARRTLLVRIAAEHDEDEISGFVVTFDDITELLSAQRKAAWADIARRIAHEIKNPLTPIQLSAERLRPQIPERHQERRRDLPDLHRHDHPACRGYRPDGRRILVVCPHAGAGAEAGGLGDDRRAGGVPAAHGASRDRVRDAFRGAPGAAALRCPAG